MTNIPSVPSYAVTPVIVDFGQLSTLPIFPFLVPLLPPQVVFSSLVHYGLEESLDVVKWVRGNQLQRVLDFDLWENATELGTEDVSFSKILNWIKAWLAIDANFAAERLFELEEELICLILSKLFLVEPKDLPSRTPPEPEDAWLTPDGRFYLTVRYDVEQSFPLLKDFVGELYGCDPLFAGSAFSYASMLIRQETLETGAGWRQGRIADQGFVPYDEAKRVLIPKKTADVKYLIANPIHNSYDASEDEEKILKSLSYFSPEEGMDLLYHILGEANVRQLLPESNTPFEYFYEDEDFRQDIAQTLVRQVQPVLQGLSSYAPALSSSIQLEDATGIVLLVETALRYLVEEQDPCMPGLTASLSYLANCLNSVWRGGFSHQEIFEAARATRGCVNLGLELCLQNPALYGLPPFKEETPLLKAVFCLKNYGAVFLFHLGWTLLFDIKKEAAHVLSQHGPQPSSCPVVLTKLSDDSQIYSSVERLIENLMFAEVQKWVESFEHEIPNELFVALKNMLKKVPLYPYVIHAQKTSQIPLDTKYFETLSEINTASEFLKHVSKNG